MNEKLLNSQWLKNQGIAVVVLILTNFVQYNYFTSEIKDIRSELKDLHVKLLECEKSKLVRD
jgi:low affinity Fe/Cu permease